jgi:exosortase A-associated hydrolase 1
MHTAHNNHEVPVQFACLEDTLFGIIHNAESTQNIGLLFIVGGSQYRIGSHRQFTLLARQISAKGFAVMRFDHRGIGDSSGDQRAFDDIQEDIKAAIDCFFQHVPNLQKVALWGLCDGGSASLFYANTDHRVVGVSMVNPWVYSEQGRARATLKYYYLRRLIELEFWRKCMRLDFNLLAAIKSLSTQLKLARSQNQYSLAAIEFGKTSPEQINLPNRIFHALTIFPEKVLIILCDADLTAREFDQLAKSSRKWKNIFKSKRIECHHLADANHTFSNQVWREQIGLWTIDWLETSIARW